jgi:hypothetical protein
LLSGGSPFASLEEARTEVAWYLDTYFNLDHRHSAPGYHSPHQFEHELKTNLPYLNCPFSVDRPTRQVEADHKLPVRTGFALHDALHIVDTRQQMGANETRTKLASYLLIAAVRYLRADLLNQACNVLNVKRVAVMGKREGVVSQPNLNGYPAKSVRYIFRPLHQLLYPAPIRFLGIVPHLIQNLDDFVGG